MIGLALLAAAVAAEPNSRTYEGDWYVSDTTDNNTGDREVYAFKVRLKSNDPDYVTLTMKCSNGQPAFLVEWEGKDFPDQAVLTIGPVQSSDDEPNEEQYVFEKMPRGSADRGLKASPSVSRQIVAAIGNAPYMVLTAHLPGRSPMVGIETKGTQGAWARVIRHCPVQKMAVPPL